MGKVLYMAKAAKQENEGAGSGAEYHLMIAYGGRNIPQAVRDLIDDRLFGSDLDAAFKALWARHEQIEEALNVNYKAINRHTDAHKSETQNRADVASKLCGDVLQYTAAQAAEWLALDAGYKHILDRLQQEIERLESERAAIDSIRRSMKAVLMLGTLRANDAMPTEEVAALLGVSLETLITTRDHIRARQHFEKQAEMEAERQRAEIRAARLQVEYEERERIAEQHRVAEAAKYERWLADIDAVPMNDVLTLVFGPYHPEMMEAFFIGRDFSHLPLIRPELNGAYCAALNKRETENTLTSRLTAAAAGRLMSICREADQPTAPPSVDRMARLKILEKMPDGAISAAERLTLMATLNS
jgi:hypothetical protein